MATDLPTGCVTYLFTDIEGSTKLVERLGDRFADLLDTHHSVIRSAIATNGGTEMRTEGDAFFAVFATPADGVNAAIYAQRSLGADSALATEGLKVRMGLHAGEARIGGDNYVGIDVNLAARISGAANGGQILVSETIAENLPAIASVVDLGRHWLKDITEPVSLLQVSADGIGHDFPAVAAAPTHPRNAPRDLSSFLGRETEVEVAVNLLRAARLVTLTGPGGTGKTRIGIEIGAAASRIFSDGVFFVPLAGISDTDSVPNAIIDATDTPASDTSVSPIDAVKQHLQHRCVLLIVDNCEHVLAAAPFLQQILDSSSKSKILATSRTPLRLRGERELAIQPLDTDTVGVDLFADRARQVKASFEVNDTNRSDVTEIIRRVDGLPLAIELAAARVRMMSPTSILQTLDPLTLSTSGAGAGVSLNDTIQWSFDLLDEAEQHLLVRLGVFPTGAELEQINRVCQPSELGLDLINGLSSLVEHSLVVSDETRGTPRFRMLETIREFAGRRLDTSDDGPITRTRHMEAYLALLEEVRPKLDSAESARWLDVLGVENANLQTAFAHAITIGDAETAQRMVASAWRFWLTRGHLAEGAAAATRALALEGAPVAVRAEALDAAGGIAYWVGDAAATRAYYDEAVAIRRSSGTTDGLANALFNLSFPVTDQDGLEAAVALIDEALEIAEADEDYRLQVLATMSMARAWLRNDPPRAIEWANRAITLIDRVDDPVTHGSVYAMLGVALFATSDTPAAVQQLHKSLETFERVGDYSGIAVALASIAHIARKAGEAEVALYVVGTVHQLRDDMGIGVNTAMDETIKKFETAESVEALATNLRSEYERGRTDDLETAIATILEWVPYDT